MRKWRLAVGLVSIEPTGGACEFPSTSPLKCFRVVVATADRPLDLRRQRCVRPFSSIYGRLRLEIVFLSSQDCADGSAVRSLRVERLIEHQPMMFFYLKTPVGLC